MRSDASQLAYEGNQRTVKDLVQQQQARRKLPSRLKDQRQAGRWHKANSNRKRTETGER